jgi:hypothetical protein
MEEQFRPKETVGGSSPSRGTVKVLVRGMVLLLSDLGVARRGARGGQWLP